MDAIIDGYLIECAVKQQTGPCLYSVCPDMCDQPEVEAQEASLIGLDDVTGEEIDGELVWKARMEELVGFERQIEYPEK